MTRNTLIARVGAQIDDLKLVIAGIDPEDSAGITRLSDYLGQFEHLADDLCNAPTTSNRSKGLCYTLREGLREFTRLRCALNRRTTPDRRY